jgi:hypothetical protein
MSDEITELDPGLVQRIAELEVSKTTQMLSMLLQAHQDAYKWLLGSLLAINGGGMLALLNANGLDRKVTIVIAIFFYLGIMNALLSGYLSQKANQYLIEPLGKSIGYWMSVAHDGEHVPKAWEDIEERIQQSVKKAWPVQVAGWISALCFSIGVLAFGCGLLNASANDAQPTNQQHLSSNK